MEKLDFNIFASDLEGLLANGHMGCWLLFVRACHTICSSFISIRDIESSHMFLIQFCKRVEELYGKEAFTPNLHLHMHLKEYLLHFGPPHSISH